MSSSCAVGIIAQAYGLSKSEAELLFNAAALHDTGKIGIPGGILFKSDKLKPGTGTW